MYLLDIVKKIFPEYGQLKEQKILDKNGDVCGWHSTLYTTSGFPYSGGTANTRDVARRIAIAECLERSQFELIKEDSKLSELFLMNEVPTTSGFAAGFDNKKTNFRSICEAVERWAWSQWIDGHYFLPRFIGKPQLSELAINMLKPFQTLWFFQKPIIIQLDRLTKKEVTYSVILAQTDKGIFPGSRVSGSSDDMWSHCAIEVRRNLDNFNILKNQKFPPIQNTQFYVDRIINFGENKNIAFRQISKADIQTWPEARLKLCRPMIVEGDPYFIWRSLCHDYVPWHIRDKTRFVY